MTKYAKLILTGFVLVSVITGLLFTQNDPVEQAKKQQDEKLQAYAAEFIQATVLYYSVHAALPWFSEQDGGTNCFASTKITTVPMESIENCIKVLIAESALKKNYLSTTPLKLLTVTSPNPQTGEKLDTIVCFQPQSKVWQQDSHTRYNIDGTHASENRCHSQGGAEYCYWCTQ